MDRRRALTVWRLSWTVLSGGSSGAGALVQEPEQLQERKRRGWRVCSLHKGSIPRESLVVCDVTPIKEVAGTQGVQHPSCLTAW